MCPKQWQQESVMCRSSPLWARHGILSTSPAHIAIRSSAQGTSSNATAGHTASLTTITCSRRDAPTATDLSWMSVLSYSFGHYAKQFLRCWSWLSFQKCVTALEKTWHTEHFFCAQCGQQFGEDGFHERDGKPYCRADYFDMFAPKCGGCNKPIMENYISALNTQWHPDCFVCKVCIVASKLLTWMIFDIGNGLVYFLNCSPNKGQAIVPG